MVLNEPKVTLTDLTKKGASDLVQQTEPCKQAAGQTTPWPESDGGHTWQCGVVKHQLWTKRRRVELGGDV